MTEAEKLEFEIMEKAQKLAALRREEGDIEVTNYTFETLEGEATLSGLFGDRDRLLMIHNMGQGCRYCTLWADGINGVLGHLEDAMSVALVSKDPPEVQRRMALDRGWQFRMASHGGGAYMAEQCAMGEHANFPGATVYQRKGGKIVRRGQSCRPNAHHIEQTRSPRARYPASDATSHWKGELVEERVDISLRYALAL